jgi:hypothetical protein
MNIILVKWFCNTGPKRSQDKGAANQLETVAKVEAMSVWRRNERRFLQGRSLVKGDNQEDRIGETEVTREQDDVSRQRQVSCWRLTQWVGRSQLWATMTMEMSVPEALWLPEAICCSKDVGEGDIETRSWSNSGDSVGESYKSPFFLEGGVVVVIDRSAGSECCNRAQNWMRENKTGWPEV